MVKLLEEDCWIGHRWVRRVHKEPAEVVFLGLLLREHVLMELIRAPSNVHKNSAFVEDSGALEKAV